MAVIPFQATPKPVVNPYVKAYDPNATATPNTPATPQASTGNTPPATPNNVSGMQAPQMSTPSNSATVPQWNVNDSNFLNMDAGDRLKILGGNKDLAGQEILRDKSVFADKSTAGDTTGAAGAHTWADQVRTAAGIDPNDPTYGNAPTTPNMVKKIEPDKPTTTATPSASGQLTPAQIAAEAKARIDKQRAALAGAIDYTKAGLKNNFDYTNKIQGDRRALETTQFQRDVSPFSGKYDYLAENMLRDRGIADTASNNQYNSAVQAEDAKLASFDQLAPEQQAAMGDELTRLERQYGLDVGSLTGQFGGAPTFAAQGQSFNQNLQTQQFAYQQARDSIKDKQYQQTFDEDVRVKGLDYALKQATLQNQITNDQAQRSIGYMNANTSAANAGTSAGNLAWSKDPNNPDNIYKKAQTDALNNKPGAAKQPNAYKTDPNFSSDVAHMKANPQDAKQLDTNPQPFIDAYGYDGYQALRKEAGL